MRPLVRYFAELMECTMRRNDHKGGWQDDPVEELLARLDEEVAELKHEVARHAINPCSKLVLREAVDVANFAMIIADRLDHEPWPDQGRKALVPPVPPDAVSYEQVLKFDLKLYPEEGVAFTRITPPTLEECREVMHSVRRLGGLATHLSVHPTYDVKWAKGVAAELGLVLHLDARIRPDAVIIGPEPVEIDPA